MCSVMSSATSSRTGGPNRRRASSRSSACSRSSSRSSTSMSALRVIRNACCSTISIPGNNIGRKAAMSSSIGRKRTDLSSGSGLLSTTNRSTLSGTLTRAKCSPPSSGDLTATARFRLRPLTNGNGCAGSTASGVRTGKDLLVEVRRQLGAVGVGQLGPRDDVDALFGQRRAHGFEEHLGMAQGDLPGAFADPAQLLAGRESVGGPDRQAHLVAALEAGHAHHVELVEVGGEDGQELGPFEQRQ